MNRRQLLGTALAAAVAADAQDDGLLKLFPGFKSQMVETSGAKIHALSGGSGPPVLLLHGAPQSVASWHIVAPQLAKDYTVIACDLRGYGDSSKPPDGDKHVNYSKRAMALDGVEVMKHFGFEKFPVAGHDRGGRVAHRMALDHPDKVTKLAVLDIVPTHYLYHHVTREFAQAYYHWFFLIQPAPFPETLLNNSIDFYMTRGNPPTPASAEYLRTFKNPATVHAMCEDYRAAAGIDLEHDEADMSKKIECPVLTLWAERGPIGRQFDVLATWRERANNVSGKGLPGGHTLQESAPNETLAETRAFIKM
jgi:haloacetate dehalogenase